MKYLRYHIGERIRALRKRRGLTTYELAKLAGVRPSTLQQLEEGVRGSQFGKVDKIIMALGYELEIINCATCSAFHATPQPPLREEG